MALRGEGALAIWNGIVGGSDIEFVTWHVNGHMPERMELPGFISGRRYVALDGEPAYFNFYEVETTAVLRSDNYLECLNNPSPWTKSVVSQFTDMSRTLCNVEASAGLGVGVLAEVLRFTSVDNLSLAIAWVAELVKDPMICAVHLFSREKGPDQVTSETKLRRAPDISWAAVLIVETTTREGADAVRSRLVSNETLLEAGMGQPAERGLYQLDYMMYKESIQS